MLTAYLIFGLWFGSLSYKIVNNPDKYSYHARFLFYPVSTIFREGFICPSIEDCVISPRKDFPLNKGFNSMAALNFFTNIGIDEYKKIAYLIPFVIGWPAKVVLNFFLILTIFVCLVGLFILATLLVVFNGLILSIVTLCSLLINSLL